MALNLKAILLLTGVLAAVVIAVSFLLVPKQPGPPVADGPKQEVEEIACPVQQPSDGYVGSASCKSCHPHQHGTWHDSYHRSMTQMASAESVLGNFDNVRLTGKGLNVRLYRKEEQFLAELSFTNPPRTDTFPVVMTTGSHNRQAYWLSPGPNAPLMILPYMFLRAEQRWIPRHSGYINPMCLQEYPELAVLEGDFGRWGVVCIKCHTTHGRPLPEGESAERSAWRRPVPQVAEFGISCEACHGPGEKHVRAQLNPPQATELGDVVNPARLPHDRSAQVCGQCHSVMIPRSDEAQVKWLKNGFSYRPGDDLHRDPLRFVVRGRSELMPAERPRQWREPMEDGSFWSDGMIRATGREYNGLLDSPCFQRGKMSCLSCHEMHQSRNDPRSRKDWAAGQLRVGMEGNGACLQCHEQFKNPEQLTKHSHHPAASSGSNCYNCHMPHTTYGLMKATRSHQISSPSVKESLETGRPNACNLCHQDKTLKWTGEYLSRWYSIPTPTLAKDEQEIAATVLWALRGNAVQRALTAWSYGWADAHQASGNQWQAPYLAQLLDDRYDAVRFVAQRSLKRLPGFKELEYDFVGAPEHRSATAQRVRQQWAQSKQLPNLASPRTVLMDQHGQLLEEEFLRLWKLRDDRPMAVNE